MQLNNESVTWYDLVIFHSNSYNSEQVYTLSQWFFDLLSNQALYAKPAAKACFGRRFKNHLLPFKVFGTHSNQDNKCNRFVKIPTKVALRAQKANSNT